MGVISVVFVQFFIGWIMGVIHAWNEKVLFVICVVSILASVIYSISGDVSIYEGSGLNILWEVPVCIFGMWCGNKSFKNVWRK